MKKNYLFFVLLYTALHISCSTQPIETETMPPTGKVIPLAVSNRSSLLTEEDYNDAFSAHFGDERNVRLNYTLDDEGKYARADSEERHVIADIVSRYGVYEGGLDIPSSLEILQKIRFLSTLTNQTPAVTIYDL